MDGIPFRPDAGEMALQGLFIFLISFQAVSGLPPEV